MVHVGNIWQQHIAVQLRLGTIDSFKADAFALLQLKHYHNGKLVLAAWVKRGFTGLPDVANWFYEGNLDEAKAALERTQHTMSGLLELEDIPEIDASRERSAVALAEEGPMAGEMQSWWAVADLEDDSLAPQVLPGWMKAHIDRVVLVWLREKNVWDERFRKRNEAGKQDLGPKMQSAFVKWRDCNTRTIVFDKQTQSAVADFKSKSQKWLRSRCFLVTIHMAAEADSLRISAGDGKEWRLKLLQGVHAGDELPAGFEMWAGGADQKTILSARFVYDQHFDFIQRENDIYFLNYIIYIYIYLMM